MQKLRLLMLAIFIFILGALQAFAAPDSFVPVVQATRDGVVNIVSEGTKMAPSNPFMDDELFRRFFGGQGGGREYKFQGTGSGFIIDKEGYIITNNHVIEDATKITVKTSDKKEYTAELVGTDPLTDLALLKIDPKGAKLKTIPLGNSDSIEIGEWVIAIGSPHGLEWTVTAGIISAKGRNLNAGPYDSFIQTDASINQGNSGGPLLNMKGEVVGINSMIYANSQGLGFAVPVNMLKDLLPQLKDGQVRRGWLGVTLQDIDEKLAESFGLPDNKGTLVADTVKGEPADKAGIKAGDIIKEVDGRLVEDTHMLVQYVGAKKPGTTARLSIIRDNKAITVNVTLGERPGEQASIAAPTTQTPVRVRDLNDAEKSKLNIRGGAMVTNVLENSAPAKEGLRAGMTITWINRKDISSASEFNDIYNNAKKGSIISVRVVTESGSRFLGFVKE